MNRLHRSASSSLPDSSLIQLAQSDHPDAPSARSQLIERYDQLCSGTVQGFRGKGIPDADLLAAARTGLLNAIDHYDPSKGASLKTFARWYVRREVKDRCKEYWTSPRLHSYLSSDEKGNEVCVIHVEREVGAVDQHIQSQTEFVFEAAAVNKFVASLTPRQRELVRRVFWQDENFISASRSMGIDRSRASRLWASVKKKGLVVLRVYAN